MRGAHPAHVTGVAEEVGVQGEALRAWFIRELLPTLLRARAHTERKQHTVRSCEVKLFLVHGYIKHLWGGLTKKRVKLISGFRIIIGTSTN